MQNIVVGKIIKVKHSYAEEIKIKILLNDKYEYNLNCGKETKLEDSRKILLNTIKEDFIFLDIDGNDIEREDENEYKIEDIFNDEIIKLKSNNYQIF